MGKRLIPFFISLFLAAPLAAEISLRSAIAFNAHGLKNPILYARTNEENFWCLQYFWVKKWMPPAPLQMQPLLGWSQTEVTAENPLGLQGDTLKRLVPDGRKKILFFYGDSFVKGHSEPDFFLPRYLGRHFQSVDVLDLSGGGFGADQSYLMFKKTHEKVPQPFVLAGILMNDDMDRAVMKLRTSKKPYFVNARGQWGLRGIPATGDPEQFFKPRILSYVYAFLRIRLGWGKDSRRPEIEALNRELVRRTKHECDSHCSGLTYVLFYPINDLKTVDWRETFFKEELRKQGVEFIDTKPALLEYLSAHQLDASSLYVADKGHHNNLGNQIIGDALLTYLREKGYS